MLISNYYQNNSSLLAFFDGLKPGDLFYFTGSTNNEALGLYKPNPIKTNESGKNKLTKKHSKHLTEILYATRQFVLANKPIMFIDSFHRKNGKQTDMFLVETLSEVGVAYIYFYIDIMYDVDKPKVINVEHSGYGFTENIKFYKYNLTE